MRKFVSLGSALMIGLVVGREDKNTALTASLPKKANNLVDIKNEQNELSDVSVSQGS